VTRAELELWLAPGEGVSQPGKLSVQKHTGCVHALGHARRERRLCSSGERLQLAQAQVAAIGSASAGTEQAALLESLIEEDVHERLL